jgi:hypothetical protein
MRYRNLLLAAVSVGSLATGSFAFAQTAEEVAAAEVDAIVVTGSRIAR